jgi:hypothetical protein
METDTRPIDPPRLIELGSVRELIRGSGSGGLDVTTNCTTPGLDEVDPEVCDLVGG